MERDWLKTIGGLLVPKESLPAANQPKEETLDEFVSKLNREQRRSLANRIRRRGDLQRKRRRGKS